MATDVVRALGAQGKHNVGVINSMDYNTIPHGAVVEEDLDNWTLVELDGYTEEGDLKCKPLEDAGAPAYLVATPAKRVMGEPLGQFFNGKGEKANLVHLRAGYTRFQVSNFELADGVEDLELGQVAHYDLEKKKFVLSDKDSPHADFESAGTQFEVVGDLATTAGHFNVPTVRLVATKVAYGNSAEKSE